MKYIDFESWTVTWLHEGNVSVEDQLTHNFKRRSRTAPPKGVRLAISQGTPRIWNLPCGGSVASHSCFQYQSTEKQCRDLSQHTATSILFIGNIANVNTTPSHKWFDCEFTYWPNAKLLGGYWWEKTELSEYIKFHTKYVRESVVMAV